MKRISITLTDEQQYQLEGIAKFTGASQQSIISLAISKWIMENKEIVALAPKPNEKKD